MKLRLVKENMGSQYFEYYIEAKRKYFPFWLKYISLGNNKSEEEVLKRFEEILKHEKELKNGEDKKIIKEVEI